MTRVATSILHAIGNTPLVQLTRVVPAGVVATVVVDSGLKYLTGDLFQASAHEQTTT